MTSTPPATATVSVLGLGAMGTALASAFLRAGHRTHVWNRTSARAVGLVDAGAMRESTVAQAIASSDLVVMSVLDADAVLAVLRDSPPLEGRAVVDLTSVTPAQSAAIADTIAALGGRAVNGAVMATPPMIATDDALVIYSGDRAAFDEHRPTLAALGPLAEWIGDAPGDAALLDLAMLDLFYGAVTSFVHAAALAGSTGRPAKDFLPFARSMLELAEATAVELAGDIDQDTFPGDENNLAMMLRGAEHLVEVAEAKGIDPGLPEVTRRLMRAAVDAGHSSDGYGRILKHLRSPAA